MQVNYTIIGVYWIGTVSVNNNWRNGASAVIQLYWGQLIFIFN